jgi:hypothetical protein
MVYDATTGLSVNMASSGTDNLTLGTGAGDTLSSGTQNVMLGTGAGTALTVQAGSVFVGFNAANAATGGNNIVIGRSAGPTLTTGSNNILMGALSDTGAGTICSVGIGKGVSLGHDGCVALGLDAATTANQQCVIGGGTSPYNITEMYVGRGVVNARPIGSTITTTGGSGTNIAGAALQIAGGRGTGTGVGGAVVFKTASAGSSGSALNALADRVTINSVGDLIINTVGRGLQIKEGSNAKMGTATLVAGTVTVSTTAVTATSRIFLTSQADGGTVGFQRVSARTAATSFVITSSNAADTSTIAWFIVEPSP